MVFLFLTFNKMWDHSPSFYGVYKGGGFSEQVLLSFQIVAEVRQRFLLN